MADNVAITAGSGTTISTDDVGGGVQVQRVKTTWGPDGTANDTDIATGKPMPIQLRSPTGTTLLGAAGTSATDVLSVQGIASGTALPVSVASIPSHAVTNAGTFAVQAAITSGTITALGALAQGATTSGQTGSLVQGAVTTSAPTYTTGQTSPVSLDTTGALRVNVTAGGAGGGVVTQGTAGNLNATVVGTGTFAVQAAITSGTITTVSTVTNLATIAGVAPAYGSGANGATVLRTALATDSPGIITVGTAGTASSQVVTVQGIASMTPILATTTPAASEVHVGEVGGKTVLFPVTLSLDTSIYASGDVLADTQIMDGFFRKADGTGIIQSIQIIDQDDQKAAFDIYFLTVNQTMGTENSAPSISDANAIEVVGPFSVATSDYKDLGGVSVAKISNVGQPVKAVTGTDDLYVAVVNGTGTPTYTASGIKLRVGGLLD